MTADLFLQLGDAHAGIAGTLAEDSSEQTQQFEVAQTNTERAWEGVSLDVRCLLKFDR